MVEKTINVNQYYTNNTPEEFYFKVLLPEYIKVEAYNGKILCDFDGGDGYDMGFLKKTFGRLGGVYGFRNVLGHLIIKSNDEPGLPHEIEGYMINYKSDDSKLRNPAEY